MYFVRHMIWGFSYRMSHKTITKTCTILPLHQQQPKTINGGAVANGIDRAAARHSTHASAPERTPQHRAFGYFRQILRRFSINFRPRCVAFRPCLSVQRRTRRRVPFPPTGPCCSSFIHLVTSCNPLTTTAALHYSKEAGIH